MPRRRLGTRYPRRRVATFAFTATAALLLAACTDGTDQASAPDPSAETEADGQDGQPDADEDPAATAGGVDEQVVGEGWQLVADLEELPDVGEYPVLAAVDEDSLTAAWDRFELSGSPPRIDHDLSMTLLLAGVGACDPDQQDAVVGEDIDLEVGQGTVLVDIDTELLGCPPAEVERTLVVTIDREALGGSDTLAVAAPHAQADRLASTERTDTPTDTEFLRRHEHLDLRADPAPVTQGDALDLDLVVAEEADSSADPEDYRPADVQVLAWDGVQWLDRARPDMEVVAATETGEDPPADVRFEVDTSDLDPGYHVFTVVPAVADPSDDEIEAAFVEVEVVAPEE